jgi:hypothetical protein
MSNQAFQLVQALVEPAIRNWLHKRGLIAGDFFAQRNLYDVIQDDAFQRELQQAMHGAAQADRPAVERLLRGFTTLAGQEWTPALQKQVQSFSGQFAEIAPYVQRWAPDVYDELHGSRGSVASLTHAIAEANRHTLYGQDGHSRALGPLDAHQIAEQVHQQLYGDADPMKTRGFSSREMGQIYGDLLRRGRISSSLSPSEVSRQLSEYAGPLSAIRDQLAAQGQTSLEEVLELAPNVLTPELEMQGLGEAERRLRMGDLLGRQGGLFSVGARQTGLAPGQDLAELERRDQDLRRQGATSHVGNLLAATQRLRQEVGFAPGSEAEKYHQQILSGNLSNHQPAQWLEMMGRSGIDSGLARQILSQPAANVPYVTPELIDTIRRSQNQVDIQPYMQRATAGVTHPAAVAGAQDQAAADLGYQNFQQIEALHGRPLQTTSGVLGSASEAAGTAARLSGFAAGSPVTRMVDAIGNATPTTSAKDLLNAGLNVVPKDKLPALPAPLKL